MPSSSGGARTGPRPPEEARLQREVDQAIESEHFADLAAQVLETPSTYRWIALTEGEAAVRDEMAKYVEGLVRQIDRLKEEEAAIQKEIARERAQAQQEAAAARQRALHEATAALDSFAERLVAAAPRRRFFELHLREPTTADRVLEIAGEMRRHAAELRRA